jgi:hypothetical protein
MSDDERELDVLLVDDPAVYERQRRPMIGRAVCVPWWNVRGWLSRPIVPRVVTGDHDRDKASEGAWTPARFEGNRKVKANLVHAGALLVDVDEAGDVDRVASALAKYATIIHSTYKSSLDKPRCRAVILLAEPIDASAYERAWNVVAAHTCDRETPAKSARAVSATPLRFAAERTLRATSVRNSRGSTLPTVGAVRHHGIRYPGLSKGQAAAAGRVTGRVVPMDRTIAKATKAALLAALTVFLLTRPAIADDPDASAGLACSPNGSACKLGSMCVSGICTFCSSRSCAT